VQCPESLRLQAYFDAEIDAMSALEIERHMERCAECRTLHQALEHLRLAARRNLSALEIPFALRGRIVELLNAECDAISVPPARPPRPARLYWRIRAFWVGAGSGLGTAAVAAILAVFWIWPSLTTSVADQLVSAHVNSLLSTHLIDVASTDQHTVKPWFAGHTEFSPDVADFAPQGYELIGGRVDYLQQQRVAVLVYQHGLHIINVFSWAGKQRGLPSTATRNGYRLIFWESGDLEYCAVSDTGREALAGLAGLLQDLGARNAQE